MTADENLDDLRRALSQYRGFVFRWQAYKQLAPDWDHDHCTGCWARFAERPEEWRDVVHTEGWVTLWPIRQGEVYPGHASGMVLIASPKFGGFQLDWLCPRCFEACRDEHEFVIDSNHPQWQKAGV